MAIDCSDVGLTASILMSMRSIWDWDTVTSPAKAPGPAATAGTSIAHTRTHVLAIAHLDWLPISSVGVGFEPEFDLKPSCHHPERPFQAPFSSVVLSLDAKFAGVTSNSHSHR
jgi:hypothetical protein